MAIIDNELSSKECAELKRIINSTSIEYNAKDFLIRYVHDVYYNRKTNGFIENDFLKKAIIKIISTNDEENNHYYVNDEVTNIVSVINKLLPLGIDTEEYDLIKNMILNNFVGNDKMCQIFDYEFYSLFNSKLDYIQIMNIITGDDEIYDNYDMIYNFAKNIAKYVEDDICLKREIISYINNYGSIYDTEDEYLEKRIDELKMKMGIYPSLDEKSIASVSRDLQRIKNILGKMEILEKKVKNYSKEIDVKTKSGIEDIEKYRSDSIIKMQDDLGLAKKELIDELNKNLVSLEASMKSNSDKIFNQLLVDARERLEQIRVASNNLTGESLKEILKIQNETNAAMEKLKNYVEKSPELKTSLEIVGNNEELAKAIIGLNKEEVISKGSTIIASDVVVPKNDFFVPEFTMTPGILRAFDRSVSFNKRMKELESKIKVLESEGYIMPSALYEALPWYMMGKKMIYFYGPTQSGKTTVVDLLAKTVDSELLDGGKITEEHSITSYNDVRGVFDENALFYALYYGKTIFYDELDNGNPDNLVVLGTFASKLVNKIDNPNKDIYVQFAKRRFVPINANARIVSAGNTSGKGRNREYTARSKMDESSLERMIPIYVGYSEDVESKIFGKYTAWYNFFKYFRNICNEWAINASMDSAEGNVTTGDASTIVECINENNVDLSSMMRGIFIQTKDEDYISYLMKQVKNNYDLDTIQEEKVKNINRTALRNISEKDIAYVFVYECNYRLNNIKKLIR